MADLFQQTLNLVREITEILLNLHVLALFIINVTKTPARAVVTEKTGTVFARVYRLIELLAGLITPLAKK